MVCNGRNGEVENYMSLQYSFTNTKASFYDKRCGQFYIQEVTSRLKNKEKEKKLLSIVLFGFNFQEDVR